MSRSRPDVDRLEPMIDIGEGGLASDLPTDGTRRRSVRNADALQAGVDQSRQDVARHSSTAAADVDDAGQVQGSGLPAPIRGVPPMGASLGTGYRAHLEDEGYGTQTRDPL